MYRHIVTYQGERADGCPLNGSAGRNKGEKVTEFCDEMTANHLDTDPVYSGLALAGR